MLEFAPLDQDRRSIISKIKLPIKITAGKGRNEL